MKLDAMLYEKIFESLHEAVYVRDTDKNILFVNKASETLTGWSLSEALGRKCFEVFGDESDTCRRVCPAERAIVEGTPLVHHEGRLRTRCGEVRNMQVSISPLHNGGGIDGAIVVMQDTTRLEHMKQTQIKTLLALEKEIEIRKRTERERLEVERRLFQAQKLESLAMMAGAVAHDFNNVLTAIIGNLDIALVELPPDIHARAGIEKALEASLRAADLSNKLLAYSGKGKLSIGPIDLSRTAEEALNVCTTCIPKNARIAVCIEKDLPTVMGDAGQVQQVITDLIRNAAEALEEEPGVISVSAGIMECDTRYLSQTRTRETPQPGRYAYVEVSDTGSGMDEETQQLLFEPFFTTKALGRGMGMSAAAGIVDAHKGAILVKSQAGQGTTIRVLLPVPEAQNTVNGQGALGEAQCEVKTHPSTGSGAILVVDDEEQVLTFCKSALEFSGFRVFPVSDGGKAVELFRRHAEDIACVLLDLTMPGMDGVAIYRELRRLRPDIKVILSSGYSEHEAMKQLKDEGLYGFIQKPYRLKTLQEKIAHVFEGSG